MTPIQEFSQGSCRLCPRMCGIDRRPGHFASHSYGFCDCKDGIMAARAALHHWEEPCISGVNGSGAIFFSGCTLRCCFCQNYKISQEQFGKPLTSQDFADICLQLQEKGAHNINLVTATQYLPFLLPALDCIKSKLRIPIVYNCGGYERTETVQALKDYVDIWLPDLKYNSPELSSRYSRAANYFEIASHAIQQMVEQTGRAKFHRYTPPKSNMNNTVPNPPGVIMQDTAPLLMDQGVIIRHMVLPGQKEDSIRLMHWIAETLPKGQYYISLLSQYTPFYHSSDYPELNRRITSYEYQKVLDTALELGLNQGFMQEKSSAKEEYTPPFDLEGL